MNEQATAPQRPFFVYGTLLPGQPNHYLWQDDVIAMATAVYPSGCLYDMGHYPMLVEMAGETVVGMVMQVKPEAYATVLARLDELEGYDTQNPQTSAYRRQLKKVQGDNGRHILAWVYLGDPQFIKDSPVIPVGDWAAYAAERQVTMVNWWENVHTVRDLHTREDSMIYSAPLPVLTIAGSDSGGAAGLQADLKTWTALGVYGMSVVTAVTAQNSLAVTAVQFMTPDFVIAQLDAVMSDYGAAAVKTGFLGRVDLIEAVAERLRRHKAANIVIDPVLVNHQGTAMFAPAVVAAYKTHLLPLATLLTPNWREAALLAGMPPEQILTPAGLATAVAKLQTHGAKVVLIKGLHDGDQIVDWLADDQGLRPLPMPYLATANRHGSGDTLSAAICAYLAQGHGVEAAVRAAQRVTAVALQQAQTWQLGAGHGPLSHFDMNL